MYGDGKIDKDGVKQACARLGVVLHDKSPDRAKVRHTSHRTHGVSHSGVGLLTCLCAPGGDASPLGQKLVRPSTPPPAPPSAPRLDALPPRTTAGFAFLNPFTKVEPRPVAAGRDGGHARRHGDRTRGGGDRIGRRGRGGGCGRRGGRWSSIAEEGRGRAERGAGSTAGAMQPTASASLLVACRVMPPCRAMLSTVPWIMESMTQW
jgi:hypothetical protein